MSFKVSIIKKNQMLAWILTIILCTAGLLNYANDPRKKYDVEVTGNMDDDLGEAVLVNSTNLVSNVDDYMEEIKNSEKLNSATEYFASSRISRNNGYSEKREVYEKILANSSASSEQLEFAQNEIKRINDEKNAISIAENLIKLKGFR